MISTILTNLAAFAMSMPTNMVILIVICLIMKVVGKTVTDCIKLIFGYLCVGLLLGIFGITMPDFLTIGTWLANLLKSIW